ncbi:MAG: hypothetical protein KDM63_18760 [Verrucomicrobiae bacterium]|nr:hypothetical protein [Verrucomicrobiae bacterium]
MDIPLIITCIDCGADAHRLTPEPEFGWATGDIVAYRCSGCLDRWDMVVADPDAPEDHGSGFDFRQWLEDRKSGGDAR